MSKKQKEKIARLEEELDQIDREYLDTIRELNSLKYAPTTAEPEGRRFEFVGMGASTPSLVDEIRAWKNRHQPKNSASIAIDLWPISDWFRLNYSPWNPGRTAQLTVGPIRMDIYES